jgi:hypothetical protein
LRSQRSSTVPRDANQLLARTRARENIEEFGGSSHAGVPEHVAVDREGESGTLADALHQPIDGIRREGPPRSMVNTYPELGNRRSSSRIARNIERAAGLPFFLPRTCKVALRPTRPATIPGCRFRWRAGHAGMRLGSAWRRETVPSAAASAVAIQSLDFFRGQILAGPQLGIRRPSRN